MNEALHSSTWKVQAGCSSTLVVLGILVYPPFTHCFCQESFDCNELLCTHYFLRNAPFDLFMALTAPGSIWRLLF